MHLEIKNIGENHYLEREIKVECFGSKGVSGESVRVLLVGVIAPIYQVISFFTQ